MLYNSNFQELTQFLGTFLIISCFGVHKQNNSECILLYVKQLNINVKKSYSFFPKDL